MENQDEIFMLEALKEAELAAIEDEVPVGAIIVRNGSFVLAYVTYSITSIVIYVRIYRALCRAYVTGSIASIIVRVRANRSCISANVAGSIASVCIRMSGKVALLFLVLTSCAVPMVSGIGGPFFRIGMLVKSDRQHDSTGRSHYDG